MGQDKSKGFVWRLGRFLEVQFPQRSKALRTGAFVVPFIFDTVPLLYRVRICSTNNHSPIT